MESIEYLDLLRTYLYPKGTKAAELFYSLIVPNVNLTPEVRRHNPIL